ncbi:MAG TPA: tetratricopeptide repeat protein [Burkholderiaceae bacterium]|jgi:MSHA biogenesis protein MshN|nr:tetratricopeptide repeat protein [Burkholderiaceae bacterium]
MSLINQMLQDLERRSVGNPVGDAQQQQIRAVPDRSGLHPAWWLVLVLTLALAGVVAWFVMRPAPPVGPSPALALKIAPDLSTLPSPVAEEPSPLVQERQIDAPSAGANTIPTVVAPAAGIEQKSDVATQPKNRGDNTTPDSNAAVARKSTESAAAKLPVAATAPIVSSGAGDDSGKPVKLTKEVKELTPSQRAENDYRQAATALQSGRNADAISDLEQALQLDSHHAAARQMLVGVLLQAKRQDEAVRRAQEGLAQDPAQIGLAMILARVQVEQNDLKSALATLEQTLSYAQDRADYQAFFAALLQRDKRHKDAIDHYVIAIGKNPQNGIWWLGLGNSLQAENRLPEAKEAFNRAKASNSLTPELLAFVNQKLAQLN